MPPKLFDNRFLTWGDPVVRQEGGFMFSTNVAGPHVLLKSADLPKDKWKDGAKRSLVLSGNVRKIPYKSYGKHFYESLKLTWEGTKLEVRTDANAHLGELYVDGAKKASLATASSSTVGGKTLTTGQGKAPAAFSWIESVFGADLKKLGAGWLHVKDAATGDELLIWSNRYAETGFNEKPYILGVSLLAKGWPAGGLSGMIGSVQDFGGGGHSAEPRGRDASVWKWSGVAGQDGLVSEIRKKWPKVTNPRWGTPFDFVSEWDGES